MPDPEKKTKKKKRKRNNDPGGTGWEIAREALACPAYASEHREHREQREPIKRAI